MLRRTRQPDPVAPPPPKWQQRFDAAVTLIRSRPQPAWLDDRLTALQRALTNTHETRDRIDASIEQLGVDQSAAELKAALRERQRPRPGDDRQRIDRRIDALRRRYDAVNDMANRRDEIEQQLLDTVADVELLAVEAVHSSTLDTDPAHHLDDHLQRLDTDLRALELARREIDAL
ncbi:MAG: hypothetical protein ABJH68_13365 [Ilumatobacter sp.]|uniref:hypothetical protein n=1 Tax=Ilumatobacter sp. TaxID=1967498 RepID=UPI003298F7AC